MLWATILLGGAGLLLGLLHPHVLAVLCVSVLVAVAYAALVPSLELPLLTSVVFAFGLLSALQGGYLVGLLVIHCTQWRSQTHPFADEEQLRSRPNNQHSRNVSCRHDLELR